MVYLCPQLRSTCPLLLQASVPVQAGQEEEEAPVCSQSLGIIYEMDKNYKILSSYLFLIILLYIFVTK